MRRPRLWTVALLLALVPAACSAPANEPLPDNASTGAGVASTAPTSPGATSGAPGSGGAADASCRTGTVTLTELDHGKTVCVATGTTVEVYLHAKVTGQLWSPPVADRTILQPAANGKGALPVGVTAGFYRAVAAGQARITAQLAPCRGPKSGPECDAVQLFEVTVTVR
jgi:hypothetical protein